MESIWQKNTKIAPRPALEQNLETQVLVIGGGMAGVLTAYHLQQRGLRVVVLEARRLGGGQTGRTSAKITAQHGALYAKLAEYWSPEQARRYGQANQAAVERYAQIVERQNIQCEFTRCPAYLYSLAQPLLMEREAEAQRSAGFNATFTTQTELPFEVAGAVRMEDQARFDPLRFLRALASELEIYENSPVIKVEGQCALLQNGCKVQARQIVFACHYPFINLPGFYFARMHQERSYVLALQNAPLLEGMYLGVDENAGWSLRRAGELLLLGGEGHRTGENREGGRYEALRQKARELWTACEEVACWSAQDCMTLDEVPYIGPYAASRPGWYVATGFNKWGMTGSMVAALLLTELIEGKSSPYEALFSPARFTPEASAENFLNDGGHALRDLTRQVFGKARAQAEALPLGHGGIVEAEGEKVGAYRSQTGELHLVSTRCPHLGCQLEWNPDEHSWDCPCHGSRFDVKGALLDGPAQTPLEAKERE